MTVCGACGRLGVVWGADVWGADVCGADVCGACGRLGVVWGADVCGTSGRLGADVRGAGGRLGGVWGAVLPTCQCSNRVFHGAAEHLRPVSVPGASNVHEGRKY